MLLLTLGRASIISSTKRIQGLELLSIPGHEVECKKVWETHVLLLAFLNSREICFAGPYRFELDYESIGSWFPTFAEEYPIVHKENIRSDFLKEKSEIFRASSPKDRKTFFNWLARVEAKKISTLKEHRYLWLNPIKQVWYCKSRYAYVDGLMLFFGIVVYVYWNSLVVQLV